MLGDFLLTPEQQAKLAAIRARSAEERPKQGTSRTIVGGRPTKREMQVLSLVAEGFSNDEIAVKLYVSENTVKHHLRNLTAKTGARNRTQLVAIAFQERWFMA